MSRRHHVSKASLIGGCDSDPVDSARFCGSSDASRACEGYAVEFDGVESTKLEFESRNASVIVSESAPQPLQSVLRVMRTPRSEAVTAHADATRRCVGAFSSLVGAACQRQALPRQPESSGNGSCVERGGTYDFSKAATPSTRAREDIENRSLLSVRGVMSSGITDYRSHARRNCYVSAGAAGRKLRERSCQSDHWRSNQKAARWEPRMFISVGTADEAADAVVVEGFRQPSNQRSRPATQQCSDRCCCGLPFGDNITLICSRCGSQRSHRIHWKNAALPAAISTTRTRGQQLPKSSKKQSRIMTDEALYGTEPARTVRTRSHFYDPLKAAPQFRWRPGVRTE
eukprot:TRINITY_DN24165_c0_g2_i1.p1 TRINITY_DN24165_c0_g2~~TRINITY_DN24165_c0_g2_i1.p1  ORF type:complete len:343 (-),score=20.30 TRINITY_DN24165_c0_g2_i1:489-1517(-)